MKISVKLSYDEELFLLKLVPPLVAALLFFVVGSVLIDVKSGLIAGGVMGCFYGLRVLFW